MSHPVNIHIQIVGGPELTDFTQLTIEQHLFEHHVFALDLSFEALGKALGIKPELVHAKAHEQLSGKDIAISWETRYPDSDRPDGGAFRFLGLIEETYVMAASDLTNQFHIRGYSHTFRLESGVQNRTFVKKSLKDIFQQVLADYPSNVVKTQVQPQQTAKLPYVAQYQESNYHFLTRLAAQQGEWLGFDGQTLRLGPPAHAAPVRFQSDGVQSFGLGVRLHPVRAEGAHYNYRTHQAIQATAAAPTQGHAYTQFALARSAEVFAQPHRVQGGAHLADRGALQQTLDQRAAKAAGRLVSLEGRGQLSGLVPGTVLDVYDAMKSGYGQFRVVAVAHRVNGAGDYANTFEALPAALTLPPPHPLAAPPLAQPELAEVIDLRDPKNLGRVRVRFQWSVKQPQDAESGWLRVSTPYSGDGKGQLFTPEKGSQVLVGYEGSAEFPVVLGNLFHPRNAQGAKYTNEGNHLKGMQTAGGNKMVMSDKKGQQTILLSNSNNKGTAVTIGFEADGNVHIRSNGPVLVNGSTITFEAGAPGKGETAYTGSIVMRAKTINLEAEEEISANLKTKKVKVTANKDITLEMLEGDITTKAKVITTTAKSKTITTTDSLSIQGGKGFVDIKGSKVKVNS